ncbi:leucine-rich repeat-containing protein 15-like [Anoplophora glabripennis]|uniref:leucine-rich repeat-containing protein 15-like n=1 Tax=Anoplophora glabripennis TaxID=217634 RepID=UPI000874B797|nr:leucine-rich repeat-containing protein 15-like [Anoplophora glabripennis]
MGTSTLVFLITLVLANSVKKSESSCESVNYEVKCDSVRDITSAVIEKIPGINKVTRLYIKFSPHLIIFPRAFSAAVNLERVIISYNKIDRISSGTFKDLPVKYINLGHNGINNIFPAAFSNLKFLESLRVDGNNLKQIPLGVFINLPMQDLALSKNNIPAIENMALENLPNLKKLRLDNNKLESIFVHRILTYPERLELLWLHNNSLTTVSNYMLQKLTNLKILNLGFNSISLIEPNSFEQTPKLNYLVLTHNHLKEIDGSIFPNTGMQFLEKMYLDNNKLMFLSSNFLVGLRKLKKITIVGNPWICSCLNTVQRLLAENNIQDMCNEEYNSGSRPVCVNENVDDTECRYSYNDNLSERFETYKKDHPLYRRIISCIL